jgi:diguanylate cyclase (GGDEF)-like protein
MLFRWIELAQRRSPRFSVVGSGYSDTRSLGGLLGGLSLAVACCLVAATVWLLPRHVDRHSAWLLCGAGVVFAVVLVVLPWERWSPSALLGVPVGVIAFLGVLWVVVPGSGREYFPLVVLAYCHAGLTQRRGISLVLVPVTVVAALAGDSWSINGAIVTFIGVALAEGLAAWTKRQRHTQRALSALVRALRQVSAAASVEEAAAILSAEAATVLGADMALVYTADQDRPDVYVNRTVSAAFGLMEIDIVNEPSGVGVALRSGGALFVSDAAISPVVSQRLVAATGMASALYVPLFGVDRPAGCLVVGWERRRRGLDRLVEMILDVLTEESGRVVERLLHAQLLTSQTLTDPLTGVGNRRLWNDRLGALRPGDVVVLLDIDDFKRVNDVHGHDRGDRVLNMLAGCLRTAIRDGDLVARIGGDEFGVILFAAGPTGTQLFQSRLETLWEVDGESSTYSLGTAMHAHDRDIRSTVAEADRALYQAKSDR